MFIKTAAIFRSRRIARFASALLATVFTLSLTAITAFAAPVRPVIANAAGVAYGNGGMTVIDADMDVFIQPASGMTYFYSFGNAGSVDLFYNGETGNPSGSYFDGPLVSGGFVASFNVKVNNIYGTPVTAENNFTITVPKPTNGKSVDLYVIAYEGAVASAVFEHTFMSAANPVVVTETPGGGRIYPSGEVTWTDSASTVYISRDGLDELFYYTFEDVDTTDVYYNGADGLPSGSYFIGPLLNGAHVVTFGGKADWIPVRELEEIIIPEPDADGHKLIIKDIANQVVFEHTFMPKFSFTAAFNATVSAVFRNDFEDARNGFCVLAVYDAAGRVAYAEQSLFSTVSHSEARIEFDLDTALYPMDAYRYSVYCWDTDYVPITTPIQAQ